jgi:hypothetical protein
MLCRIKKKSVTCSLVLGMGKVIVINGSKVVDWNEQSGHVTIDRYWPDMRSVTIDWLRLRWAIQLSSASWGSFLPASSTDYT